MARAVPVPLNRVQRPHLMPAQEALQIQYRPQPPCRYCAKELGIHTQPGTVWLMEVPRNHDGLEFYCSNCGHYVFVPLAS
jgi:hypothetical protein